MRRYFLSCPIPGALALPVVAPPSDQQPAEVRLIQAATLKDKEAVFLLLSKEKASSLTSYFDHTLHGQLYPISCDGDIVTREKG